MSETDPWAGWHWCDRYLVCDLLSDWKHGFFTRSHSPQLPDHLQTYLGTKTAYRLKQVHGDRLLSTADISPVQLAEADGLYSNCVDSLSSIWVCSADCVPLLIGDRTLGTVAAIHAGWRGTAAKIVPKIIAQFQTNSSRIQDLVVALGPAISGGAYQVKAEVAEQVLSTIANPIGVSNDSEPGHFRLDIRLIQQQQLIEAGLLTNQIAIAPYCTFNCDELFFSYRRQSLGIEKVSIEQSQNRIQWSGICTAKSVESKKL